MDVLILKTAALGDVLRTTSILPGLREAWPEARIEWVTAREAVDLVRLHPLVDRVHGVDVDDAAALALVDALAEVRWDRVLSFDDERPVCALASALAERSGARVTGAHLAADGTPTYTDDAAPWFDMGLLSRHGKAAADALKLANEATHAELFARMLGIRPGRPRLELTGEALEFAERFLGDAREDGGPLVALNTGAGGRWESKRLDVERTVGLVRELDRRLGGATFLLLGGPGERARNAEILAGCSGARVLDPGVDNALLEFAALVSAADVLVTSDSLALHVAVARGVPLVAFFAPTSAAEIDLFGLGEKVVSLAPDAGSYRTDADTSTLTVERLADAVERTLARHPPGRSRRSSC